MSGFLAIYRREMLSLWVSPLAWILLFVFLVIQGVSFYLMVEHFANFDGATIDYGPVAAYFGQSIFIPISLIILCPALTMRLFAEERRSGTIETLLTAPVSPWGVVLGKYLATLTTYVLIWAPTLLYVIILRKTGTVDWPVVGASYLGLLGIGAAYLAVGMLMSALSKSQLISLILSLLLIFGLFILGIGEYVFPPGPLRDVCGHVSVFSQLVDFSKGIVDLRRVVFDLTLMGLPLFLTARIVDSWRWD